MQACVCEQIVKSSQKIRISTDRKRYGKIITLITGFDKDVNVKKIAKSLKNELACGGTFKDGTVELQGNHVKKIKPLLEGLGFDQESIE